MSRAERNLYLAEDGTALDILVSTPEAPRACVLLYPCIGGTTRAYMPPREDFVKDGFALVEYHPRGHGKSKGQMSMEVALEDLRCFLAQSPLRDLPIVGVGHSAGCNALLQFDMADVDIRRLILLQPVFDFRESMFYMYNEGTESEFVEALAKWITDRSAFEEMVATPRWLDEEFWHRAGLRERIDGVSAGMRVGRFLENFYIPGFSVGSRLGRLGDKPRILLSNKDNWYPVDTTRRLASAHGVPLLPIAQARDHFFTDAWGELWPLVRACFPTGLE